jgi:DNA-binding IclR family transcriptional regulator
MSTTRSCMLALLGYAANVAADAAAVLHSNSDLRNYSQMSVRPLTPPARTSSRRRTRETGTFVRDTPGSRSLERGLAIVRAFRLDAHSLTNAEIAATTGLARTTVSRLTSSLVDAGFLEYDIASMRYRLGPPFLSFGKLARRGSVVLSLARPLMREIAEELSINVGLAVADAGDMIYLDSVRRSRLGVLRRAAWGGRLPIAETALGRAWVAGVAPTVRADAFESFARTYGTRWPALQREIERAVAHVERHGWCGAIWKPGMVAIASPLVVPGQAVHAMNFSFPNLGGDTTLQERHAGRLLVETVASLRATLIATSASRERVAPDAG